MLVEHPLTGFRHKMEQNGYSKLSEEFRVVPLTDLAYAALTAKCYTKFTIS